MILRHVGGQRECGNREGSRVVGQRPLRSPRWPLREDAARYRERRRFGGRRSDRGPSGGTPAGEHEDGSAPRARWRAARPQGRKVVALFTRGDSLLAGPGRGPRQPMTGAHNGPGSAADAAVGGYLRALDEQRRAPRTRAAPSSPMGKLFRAQAKLARAHVEAAEDGFIRHAAAWSRRERVSARTLREFGVSADVLRRAGLEPATIETDVRAWYRRASFTVQEVAQRAGVSVATARRVVSGDVDQGLLIVAGQRSRQRGRPAVAYRLAQGRQR